MSRLRIPARLGAALVAVALPLVGGGVVNADTLPGGIPVPPGVPQSGQPITIVYNPPSLATIPVPPAPEGCVMDTSYDNTGTAPPGSIFRGQSACGLGIYAPVLSGHAVLLDLLGNVVASGNSFGQVGGVGTSQGDYVLSGSLASLSASGPVPGVTYTIRYDASITLTYPQYWGPPPAGCWVSGQTLSCSLSSAYTYIPGTQGGLTPG